MSHRAEQILDAIVALIPNTTVRVLKHAALSLNDEAQDVPAVSVTMGDDTPADDDGAENFAFLDSLLAVECIALVNDSDEIEAKEHLSDLRALVHKALMADRSLGLTFVIDTRYGGAIAPELQQNELMAGRQVARWFVHYRMNVTDPE